MKKIITGFVLSLTLLYAGISFAQCSDAGVCIIGSKHRKNEKPRSSLSFEYSVGSSGKSDFYTGSYTVHEFKLGAEFVFSDKFSLTAVLPAMSVIYSDPNLLTKNGLADATVLAAYTLPTGKLKNISFEGGLKLATSGIDPDKFAYFNAQGTNDLILGVDYNYSFFNISGGAQIPLNKYDRNGVTFKRGADVLFRAGYQRKADDLFVRFELLAVKRLSKSELTLIPGSIYEEPESDFFQMNIMGGMFYYFSNDVSAGLNAYLPMLNRNDNSDGTRRSFTIAAKFNYSFNL
ncbi:MAG: hypothetical protein LWX07_06970 [Bacteroidetes bacterium]|nr:hypothetical protein [Bacteroidota bacterium]